MRIIILFFGLLIFVGCSNKKGNRKDQENRTEKSKSDFPKYESVIKMLKSANDYDSEKGNLKVLKNNPLHIQVSSWAYKNDPEESLQRNVKHDIVYVSFQAFAKTDINKLTVTSVPQLMPKNLNNISTHKYLNSYKKTVTVNRNTAKNILKKYLDTSSFKDLYQLDSSGKIWIPNNNFELLKDEKPNSIFNYLTNNE